MKISIKTPAYDDKGNIILKEISLDDIVIGAYSILAIDGSTTNTGMAIIRESDGGLMYLLKFTRDSKDETPVQYKVRLKREVLKLFQKSSLIQKVYYEEPCIDNISAVSNIYMLRTFVEEIVVENEPDLDYIKHYEINNKRWKKLFLAPDKCPTGTELEKKAVRDKLFGYMPFLEGISQDEVDATAMGFVVATSLREGIDSKDLESQKKPRPFKYNIDFIGAECDDGMLTLLHDVYSGPEKILQNGIQFTTIVRKTDFDKHVYKQMGNDDKLLIIKFASDTHADVILKNKIGVLAAQYPYIYALVWRCSRK